MGEEEEEDEVMSKCIWYYGESSMFVKDGVNQQRWKQDCG